MRVSVIIPVTRPGKALLTIESVLNNTSVPYEIIVIAQGISLTPPRKWSTKVRIIPLKRFGTSHARNVGLCRALGDIVCFTDDDCIADSRWIVTISSLLGSHKDVIGVFGKVLPYEASRHRGYYCPSQFISEIPSVITRPGYHAEHIGFGNNMAFRKNILQSSGGFRTWLGGGSVGLAAEDAQMTLNLLISGYTVMYTPRAVVYHDRWLSKEKFIHTLDTYICGEMSCYTYFACQGQTFAQKVLRDNLRRSVLEFTAALSNTKDAFALLRYFRRMVYRARGLCVGLYYAWCSYYLHET